MRNFNNDEKFLLKYIFESYRSYGIDKDLSPNMANLVPTMADLGVWNLFGRIAIESDVKIENKLIEKKILISSYSEKTYGRQNEEKLFKIQYDFAILLSLLNYLEKNYLIHLVSFPADLVGIKYTFNEKIILEDRPDGRIPVVTDLPLSSEYNFIFESYNKSIIPTTEVLDFIKFEFKDKEQIRHEENLAVQKDSIKTA